MLRTLAIVLMLVPCGALAHAGHGATVVHLHAESLAVAAVALVVAAILKGGRHAVR